MSRRTAGATQFAMISPRRSAHITTDWNASPKTWNGSATRSPRKSSARQCPRHPREILATELVEEEIGLRVPVRRLRYKDGRNMAMRGDDFIGAGYDAAGEKLWLLKGEAKSNKVLGKATVTSARKVLDRDNGRCTPDSLLFVANRLLESNDPDDNALGRSLRDEVGLKSLRADRIDHMLFTVSGNGPHASLKDDIDATGTNRDHYVLNIHVEDHQDFIAAMYQEAEDLGDD